MRTGAGQAGGTVKARQAQKGPASVLLPFSSSGLEKSLDCYFRGSY